MSAQKRGRYDNSDSDEEETFDDVLSKLWTSVSHDDEKTNMFRERILEDRIPEEFNTEDQPWFVRRFLMSGGDVNARTEYMDRPIIVALLDEKEETVDIIESLKILIKFGANVNAKSGYGKSALSVALLNQMRECVKILYNANAKSDNLIVDGKSYTALDLIKKKINDLKLELSELTIEADGPLVSVYRRKLRQEEEFYTFVKKLERERWTGKTVRAVQQWRPDGNVDRPQGEYIQMRDIFRKFGSVKSGYLGGGRSRSRSRSRSRRRRSSYRRSRSRGRRSSYRRR